MENKFYSIRVGTISDNEHQLNDLGAQVPSMSFGDSSGIKTFYRNTTSEDYDKSFASRLMKIKPPYEIEYFLEYHYNDYIQKGEQKEIFFKHIKYVIIPLITKKDDSEIYVTLVNEWINNKLLNR